MTYVRIHYSTLARLLEAAGELAEEADYTDAVDQDSALSTTISEKSAKLWRTANRQYRLKQAKKEG